MNYIHLEQENFDELIKNGIVLLDFYASWCGPCKMFGPVFEEVSHSFPDYKFIKIDVDKFEDIAKRYGVMSIPTIIKLENGKVLSKKLGYMNSNEFISFIK